MVSLVPALYFRGIEQVMEQAMGLYGLRHSPLACKVAT